MVFCETQGSVTFFSLSFCAFKKVVSIKKNLLMSNFSRCLAFEMNSLKTAKAQLLIQQLLTNYRSSIFYRAKNLKRGNDEIFTGGQPAEAHSRIFID